MILFPEVAFDKEKFLAKVDANVKKYGYCTVVVSEGVKSPDGKFLADQGLKDAFGHAQLGGVAPVVAGIIKEGLGLKYHWGVADYLQRAARHIASKTRRGPGLRHGQGRGGAGRQGQELRDADGRARVEQALQVESRRRLR